MKYGLINERTSEYELSIIYSFHVQGTNKIPMGKETYEEYRTLTEFVI
jgi:hypothetical protein